MNPTTNEQLMAELDRLRAQQFAVLPNSPVGGGPAALPSMMAPPMAAPAGGGIRAVGLMVSITIPTPAGEVPCYLQLGPEAAANPQAAVQALMQAGWPVKCWQPRQQNGWGGGYQGGGYQGGGMRRGWGRY